jgi:hypothetical protein
LTPFFFENCVEIGVSLALLRFLECHFTISADGVNILMKD